MAVREKLPQLSPPMNLADCWKQLLSNKLGSAAWVAQRWGANYQTHAVQFSWPSAE